MDFVSQECARLGLRAGAIVFRGLRIGPACAALRAEITREVQAIRARLADVQAVRALPEVAAFQAILRAVGVNPRRTAPSVERLLGLALKRGELPAINNLVDSYNLVSVRSLCSLGAHDLDQIALPVQLRLLTGRETFTALGSAAPEPINVGEYGYVDAQERVLCRLDVRQAEFSKVTERTRNALLIVEGTAVHDESIMRAAVEEVTEMVQRYCGGAVELLKSVGRE